ncbi:polysaccharide deacetylase family protein [Sphingomonas cannabina]|uniref:polysaccharide deacetylase family protein n=1 Tax=Sphingomonas cannabina TaxID=2899123 RepID=UPI001F2AECAD|nr:polysaccharide deacetylase family protein [Sphingomonas cannabina]UIJ44584.1 polysaccharide deacetylase family protein [Sphingomonas cannabina]
MVTPVFLTIDTELKWGHHAAGLDVAAMAARSLEPAGVGIGWQLDRLAAHGLKATFFVDPMPALVHGIDAIRPVVEAILAAGQEVQLHLHPNWAGANAKDRAVHGRFELTDLSAIEQRAMIDRARSLLVEAGAPVPVAFRAGSYAANDDTLAALASLGFAYDSSHNGCEHPWPSAIGLPRAQIAPIVHRGIVEVPVTVIEDRAGRLRHFQICALSAGEMRAALDHAARERHAAVTIVGHSFELANRAGTRPNRVHVARFEALCRLLSARRDTLPTAHFAERPALALRQGDVPLGASLLRTGWRQAEQLWSNLVEERAA